MTDLSLLKLAEDRLRLVVNNQTNSLAFLPLTPDSEDEVKAFIDVAIDSIVTDFKTRPELREKLLNNFHMPALQVIHNWSMETLRAAFKYRMEMLSPEALSEIGLFQNASNPDYQEQVRERYRQIRFEKLVKQN